MGCCGQHRNAGGPTALSHRPATGMAVGQSPSPAWPLHPGNGATPDRGVVPLRSRERARLLVRGPVTGRAYEFSAAQPIQAVDARDAESLLRTRLFLRAT